MGNKPQGLKITRRGDTGNKYTATWKPDKDFIAQKCRYGYTVKQSNGTKKTTFSKWDEVGKARDSYNFDWDKDHFYPYTSRKIVGIDFAVIGKTKKNGWTNSQAWETFPISKPPDVKIVDQWDSSSAFKSKFTWGLAKNWGSTYLNEHQYSRFQYRTKIKERLNADSESELNKWFANQKTGVSTGTGTSWSHNETGISNKYMDRAIQVRAQGPWGDGDWAAKRHAYGDPPISTNVKTKDTKISTTRQTMSGVISWNFEINGYRVVDRILVEYLIAVPTYGLKPPVNASWDPLETFSIGGTGNAKKKTKKDSYEWEIHKLLEPNQCLWLRVSSINDNNKTDGVPQLQEVGKLASPTITNLSPDPDSHRISVTATNNASEVPDSYLVVVYHDSAQLTDYEGKALAVIPHGKSTVTFQAPDWGDAQVGVEVYAVAAASIQTIKEDDGVTVYNIAAYSYRYHGVFNGALTCAIECPDYPYKSIARPLMTSSTCKDVSVEAYDNTGYLITPVIYDFAAGEVLGKVYPIGAVVSKPNSTPIVTVSAIPAAQAVEAYFSFTLLEDSKSYMISDRSSDASSEIVPKAPNSVMAVQLGEDAKIQVTWDVPWSEADGAEVSWADHDDAWYSTAGPSTYDVENVHNPILNIADVSLGARWYIKVRLYKNTNDGGRIYGPYKDANEELGGYCDLSSSPAIPVLELSDNIISEFGNTTASWVYVSSDTTNQAAAKIFEIIEGEDEPRLIAEVTTAQHVVLYAEEIGWENNSEHDLVLQVFSESGNASEYSDVQTLTIAAPLHCQITSFSPTFVEDITNPSTYSGSSVTVSGGTAGSEKEVANLIVSLTYSGSKIRGTTVTINGEDTVIDWSNYADNVYGGTYDLITGVLTSTLDSTGAALSSNDIYEFGESSIYLTAGNNTISASNGNVQVKTCDTYTRSYELREMPLGFTVTGAGEDSYTYITIERAENYVMDRPDDVTTFGAKGEVVCQYVYSGETAQSITLDKLSGYLDDGADYIFTAMIQDALGQVSSVPRNLSVRWSHQARIPGGTVTIQNGIAIITPIAPANSQDWTLAQDDYADIYRLTADKPQLVYSGAEFGTAYVDPYPTIGKEGGYRIVFRTANGDYITDEYTDTSGNLIPTTSAWYDIHTNFKTKFQLIDFGGTEIEFKYNITLDNSWKKKFTQTNYLGGSTQGDWDAGTNFETSVSGNTFYDIEPEVYEELRDLADYSGLCHLRTIDGTNICCNIEVSDNSTFNSLEHQHDISLSIQKVDNPELDGMSLEEWNYGEE